MTQQIDTAAEPLELDARSNNGIHVRLLWNPADDTVSVAVSTDDEAFVLPVQPCDALDAFHHPFAYAAYHGIAFSTGRELQPAGSCAGEVN